MSTHQQTGSGRNYPPLTTSLSTVRAIEDKHRNTLRGMGIGVEKCRLSRHMSEPFYPTKFNSTPYDTNYDENGDLQESYTLEWTIKLDGQKLGNILSLVEDAEWARNKIRKTEEESMRAMNQLNAHQSKLGKLRKTLDENPGMDDQWKEFMVLLKMAGFDEDIV